MYFVCDIYGRDLGRNMTFSLGQRVQNLSFIHRFFLSQIEAIHEHSIHLQERIVPLLLIHHIKIQVRPFAKQYFNCWYKWLHESLSGWSKYFAYYNKKCFNVKLYQEFYLVVATKVVKCPVEFGFVNFCFTEAAFLILFVQTKAFIATRTDLENTWYICRP